MEKRIIVTKFDEKLLRDLIKTSNSIDPVELLSHQNLLKRLDNAIFVDYYNIPEDVIRFDSIVTIMTSFGRKQGLKIVMPEEADISRNRLSALSPAGSALFGKSVNDISQWYFNEQLEELVIERVQNSSDRTKSWFNDCTYFE
jgi:regulator of nucleoside diphosphate kinase